MTAHPSVEICIATYRFPEGLRRLLASLQEQTVPFHVIIVDNDSAESGRGVSESFAKVLSLTYLREPRKNISLARNRALDAATADWVALIDDDEVAAPDWLERLLTTATTHQADVVFGAVLPCFPFRSVWVDLLEPVRQPTGTILAVGDSSSALVRRSAIGADRFDPGFGISGGGDSEFFHRLHGKGVAMVWCDEAIVEEYLTAPRCSVAAILRRQARTGATIARVFHSTGPLLPRLGLWLRWAIRAAAQALLVPLTFPFSPRRARLRVLHCCHDLGRVIGTLGWRLPAYSGRGGYWRDLQPDAGVNEGRDNS